MNHSVIDIQGITKTYVNGKLTVPVLHGIDLQVQKAISCLSWDLPVLVNQRL